MIWGAFDRNRLSQCIAGRDIHADFQLEIELPAGSELDFAVGVTPLHVGTAYRLSAHPDRGGAAIVGDRQILEWRWDRIVGAGDPARALGGVDWGPKIREAP